MAVILFIFNTILAIQYIGNQALLNLNNRVDIVIYLKNNIEFYQAKNLTQALESLKGVKKVKYTSQTEALEIVSKTHPKTAEFLTRFNIQNPLPPSISIITESPEYYGAVQQVLTTPKYKDLMDKYVAKGTDNDSIILSTVAENITNMNGFVKQLIFWMVLIFILGGTLVVINAIQLTIYTRRQEIHIMRLVGATPNFIRLPFLFEGVIYGVFSVLLSFLLLFLIGNTVKIDQTSLWSYYNQLAIHRVFFFELIITCALSFFSSFSAVEQHSKGKLSMH
jgi:cell division transport system permease protein